MESTINKKTKISIAHSPDADDAFMFYALSEGIVSDDSIEAENILKDIQTLNEEGKTNKYDVQAISFHAYPELQKEYQLLSCGGSLGYGYGPTLITNKDVSYEDFIKDTNKTIAIPGEKTSAFLLLKLFLGDFKYKAVPFDQIIDSVKSGEFHYGLLIHEGQLSYEGHGLKLIKDLGKWWLEETGLPVPLGGNIVRRSFSTEMKKKINKVIKESIEYGINNQKDVVPKVTNYAREIQNELDKVDKFVGMYVNKYTIDYGDEGRKAIKLLFEKAMEKGYIKEMPNLDFVE